MIKMKKGKVVLIGTGFVGMSMAYSMLNRGGVNELVLIDIDKDKTVGEEMDLSHGLPFAPQKMMIKSGDYDDCKDAQVIVITAGIAQKPGQTRLELAETNTKIMKSITQNIMKSGFDGVIIVASNPVDLMTYVVAKVSGLPKNQVIGSGTVLDTARLRYIMSDYFKVSSKNIHAYVMGEHGDSSFVPWNNAYVGCKNVKDVMKDNNHPMEDLEKIHYDVVNAAYEIINKKKATYYGIGMALSKLVKAVLDNENSILTVSTYLKDGEYGQDDIYIGVPAIIDNKGVRELLKIDLTKEEQEKLDNSCRIIKEMREQSIEKIIEE
jgi:L-lactate dehydrogenase